MCFIWPKASVGMHVCVYNIYNLHLSLSVHCGHSASAAKDYEFQTCMAWMLGQILPQVLKMEKAELPRNIDHVSSVVTLIHSTKCPFFSNPVTYQRITVYSIRCSFSMHCTHPPLTPVTPLTDLLQVSLWDSVT